MRSPRAAQGNSRARSASTSYVTESLVARSRLAQFRWSVGGLPLPAAVRPEILAGIAADPSLEHRREAGSGGIHVGLEVTGLRHFHFLEMQDEATTRLARRADKDQRRMESQRENSGAAGRARRPPEERDERGCAQSRLVGEQAECEAVLEQARKLAHRFVVVDHG